MPLYISRGVIRVTPSNYIGRGAIGDPNLFSPYGIKVAAPPELFRFMGWGGSSMQAVTLWKSSGFELCAAAQELSVTMPFVSLSLVSSTRGWLSSAQGTGQEWFNFLACSAIEPWKSNFNNYGKG